MTTSSTSSTSRKSAELVPRLRFPEFEGEWEAYTLNDVCARITERIPVYEVTPRNYTGVENLIADFGGRTDATSIPNNGTVIRYLPSDILISNIRPYLSKIWKADHVGGASNDVIVLRANELNSSQFLLHFVRNSAFIDYVMIGAKGVKMPRGDISQLLQYPTPIPTLPEQQKIADCLSSLDDLITAESAKLEALKEHKKGLMQELFPREGETTPRLRFPEFEGSGEWEVKRLGELLAKKPDYGVNAPAVSFSPDLPAYIRITDILDEGKLSNNLTSVNVTLTDQNILRDGDIVVARTGASVGKSYQYRPQDGTLVFAGFLIRLAPQSHLLDTTYLANYMTSNQYWLWVSIMSVRSGQPGLNAEEYSSFPIPVPPYFREQQKIAAVLSSLDDRITAQSERIELLKNHKKGLMQQLFPVMEG